MCGGLLLGCCLFVVDFVVISGGFDRLFSMFSGCVIARDLGVFS